MKIDAINSNASFGAKIKIGKQKILNNLLETGGTSSVFGGSSTISAGVASGSDMIVHNSESAVPVMQWSSGMFDQFADFGHKFQVSIFDNQGYKHNGYDASFFSTSMSANGSVTYTQGMNNIVKGIENKQKLKIPT